MAVADTVKSLFGIGPRLPVYVPAPNQRKFSAAKHDRLTSDWIMSSTNINEDIKNDLAKLRMRARDLCENNDHAKQFLRLLKSNVVGPAGIKMQNKAKDRNGALDKYANDTIEAGWKEWCKKQNCTVTGKFSFIDVQDMAIETLARDGEVFVRMIRNYDNPFRFALQFIDPEMVEERLNKKLKNGNEIFMGIEFNSWGRPVAYHVKTEKSNYAIKTTRIPAKDILHWFIPLSANAARSVTWFHTAAKRMHILGGYEEAEVVAARTAAAKMGFFTKDGEAAGSEYVGDDQTDDGDLISEVSPGVFEVLPAGMGFESFDPTHPTQQYGDFVKSVLRGIASGLGVSYAALSGDLSDANYSSLRAGMLQDRDLWRKLQMSMVDHLCQPIFENWLEMALLSGRINLPFFKYEKFNAAAWQPRGWAWVDPEKDMKAALLGVNNGVKTKTQVASEQGYDIEEIFQELQRENELAERYSLNFGGEENASGS